MGFQRTPTYIFNDKTSTGIDKVPVGRIITVKNFDGETKSFTKISNTGLLSTTTIEDIFDNDAVVQNIASGTTSGTGTGSYIVGVDNRETITISSDGTTLLTTNYNPDTLSIYVNGIKLTADSYTATNGTSITLDSGVDTTDVVEVISQSFTDIGDIDLSGSGGTSIGEYRSNVFEPTVSTTTFNVAYNPDTLNIFVNGLRLTPGSYTATNGTSIVLNTAVEGGDVVEIISQDFTPVGDVTAGDTLPSQTGNAGKVLGTNGTVTSWVEQAVGGGSAEYPSQTGNTGKYLSTDGTSVLWSTITHPEELPSQTGNTGKFLTTDGTTSSWGTVSADAVAYDKTNFTATAGQTVFTKSYEVGYIDVYVNGLKIPSAEFTATNGTSVTIGGGTNDGDIVEMISYQSIGAISLDHTAMNNIGTNTHAQIDTHIADTAKHFTQAEISITESQISDLGTYAPQATTYTKSEVDTAVAGAGGSTTAIYYSGGLNGGSKGSTDGVQATLPWGDLEVASGIAHSAGLFTIATAGKYLVHVGINYVLFNATSGSFRIYKGANIVKDANASHEAAIGSTIFWAMSVVIDASIGDIIKVTEPGFNGGVFTTGTNITISYIGE